MGGQVVGDHHDRAGRVGGLDLGQQPLVAGTVARRASQGDLMAITRVQGTEHQVFSGPRP
jgi:hypothetical protein